MCPRDLDIRLERLRSLFQEANQLLKVLGIISNRASGRVELSAEELQSLLDATQNIIHVIDLMIEDLPEEAAGVFRRSIGYRID